MSEETNSPLPSDTGVVGSRKITLTRTIANNQTPEDEVSNLKETKSTIVDSVFSNFVAKKIEQIAKEKKSKTDDSEIKEKKHKHKKSKKEKHKKHKHKDKLEELEKESEKHGESSDESVGKVATDGFFAKECFLDPKEIEKPEDGLENVRHKSKKQKKHKKKDHKHKRKHKSDKEHKPRDANKLLSFHDDMESDSDPDSIHQADTSTGVVDDEEKQQPKNLFADRFEKAIESKLSSLKENLTKKHKALEDLNKELKIPEKKIKMMTEITLSEQYKKIQDEERKSECGNLLLGVMKPNDSQACSALAEYLNQKEKGSQPTEVKSENNKGKDEDGFVAMKPKKELYEEVYGNTSNGKDEAKASTSSQIGKKSFGMKLGLKLSENSMSLISSGVKIENDPKKRNREEGEITDSQDGTDTSSSSSSLASEISSDGEIKEDKHSKKRKKDVKRDKEKKKSRNRSRSSKRTHRSRSRSYDQEKGVWKSRSSRRHRSRSRSRDRSRRGRTRDDHYGRSGSRDRSRRTDRNFYYNDRYKARRSRSRERKKSPEDLRLKIDKAKLREIAMKNAYAMFGEDEVVKHLKPEQIAALRAGGKSVEELTDFCKKIAERDGSGSSDDEDMRPRVPASDDEEAPFIHHPFKMNPANNIALNIRNARQLPVTSFADRAAKAGELRLQFPVSSGSQHKHKEDEWVPVEKPTATATTVTSPPTKPTITATTSVAASKPLPKPAAIAPPPPPTKPQPDIGGGVFTAPVVSKAPEATVPSSTVTTAVLKEKSVFPDLVKVNISDVVSERLSALRKLQSNPHDVEAMGAMYKSQKAMQTWAQNQQVPGQFTGSTGVKPLSAKQLQGTGQQPWIKKIQSSKVAFEIRKQNCW